MGYKSVITTWKKIQDWVLELLEGLGLGTAYKYDKASDTATVKAGTIKNASDKDDVLVVETYYTEER